MIDPIFSLTKSRHAAALLTILLFLLAAYGNTFHASWHMDDYPNILNNPAIQMTAWNGESLLRAVGIDQLYGNNLSRPVANLSFALNWFLHGDNVTGFHLINLVIHILNAWLVYRVILLIGTTPRFPARHRAHIYSIALGTSLLWALNPMQTQAVTYIVQRMASLMALFYIAALASFIQFRLATRMKHKVLWGGLVLAGFILAMGTKENASMLPLALALVEIIFFQEKSERVLSPRFGATIIMASLLVVVFSGVYFYGSNKDIVHSLTRSFEMRPFSLMERLMTQPRVLVFYISLVFYPIPQRLSLEHDFTVSTSLLHPWTTLPSILIVGLLIGAGILMIRKRPLEAFAVLFFFLNHVVESSILPLELVFEHRNYVSSIFVFLPIAAGWFDLKKKLRLRSHQFAAVFRILPILVVFLLCAGTYARNMDWRSEGRLWSDTQRKAPGRARPVFNLAKELERAGSHEQAIILYIKSMSLQPPRRKHFEVMALTNIGTIYFKKGDLDRAIAYYEKALEILPATTRSRYNIAVAYTETGQFERTTEHLDWLIENNPDDIHALNLKGFVLLKQHRLEESLLISRRLLQLEPDSRAANLQMGVVLTEMDYPDQGDWFLRRAYRVAPGDLTVMLCMLENHLARRDQANANRIINEIFNRFSIGAIAAILNDSVNEIGDTEKLRIILQEHIHTIGRSQSPR